MNYIWEMVLKAKENNIAEKELFFKQALEYSPYYEQSFLELDRKYIDKGEELEVNALYRFDKIVQLLLDPNIEEYVELNKYLFDITMHFLVNVDIYSGFTRQDLYLLKIKESLLKGHYGKEIANTFEQLKKEEKEIVLLFLIKELKLGSSLRLLRELLTQIYPTMMLYQVKTKEYCVLLYLGIKEEEWEKKRLQLFLDLFVPILYQVRVFWEHHFGVIDIEETMKLDHIELY